MYNNLRLLFICLNLATIIYMIFILLSLLFALESVVEILLRIVIGHYQRSSEKILRRQHSLKIFSQSEGTPAHE